MPGNVKTSHDEHLWSKAKAIALKEYKVSEDSDRFYAIVMGIYKRMKGIKKSLGNVVFLFKGRKLHYKTVFQGLPISVENRKGSIRRGEDKNGEWQTKMKIPYGYIRGTMGTDSDQVDCFIGPNKESDKVYVIHIKHPENNKYDEDKVFLGFDTIGGVLKAFKEHYDEPSKYLQGYDILDMETFKKRIEKKGKKIEKSQVIAHQRVSSKGKIVQVSNYQNRKTKKVPVTETKAFKAWFGNSVVTVNGKPGGKPLVLYHGTHGDFNTFDTSFGGTRTGAPEGKDGFYFTHDTKSAESFLGIRSGANIMPVYLKMGNPLIVIRTKGSSTILKDELKWESIDRARINNNDGIIYRGFRDSVMSSGKVTDTYFIFKPTQIKSAIGNRGTFDPKNPNITKSVRFIFKSHVKAHTRASGRGKIVPVKSYDTSVIKNPKWKSRKWRQSYIEDYRTLISRPLFTSGMKKRKKRMEELFKLRTGLNIRKFMQIKEGIYAQQAQKDLPNYLINRGIENYKSLNVKSPEFKAWFGDWENDPKNASKVIDKTGKPLIVFHGTHYGGFKAFDPNTLLPGLMGKGFYFTEDKKVAESYKEKGTSVPLLGTHYANIYDLQDKEARKTINDIAAQRVKENEKKLAVILKMIKKSEGLKDYGDFYDLGRKYGYGIISPGWLTSRRAALKHRIADLKSVPNMSDVELNQYIDESKYMNKTHMPTDREFYDRLKKNLKPLEPMMYSVYLNIRNPLNMDDPIPDSLKQKVLATPEIKEGLKKFHNEQSKHAPYGFTFNEKRYKELYKDKLLNAKTYLGFYAALKELTAVKIGMFGDSVDKEYLNDVIIKQIVKENGYDGITHIGGVVTKSDIKHRVWITLQAKQIKAVDNRGTFNKTIDIYKSLYGAKMNIRFIFKSHVKKHTRKTKTGKIATVKDYENRKVKTNSSSSGRWYDYTDMYDLKMDTLYKKGYQKGFSIERIDDRDYLITRDAECYGYIDTKKKKTFVYDKPVMLKKPKYEKSITRGNHVVNEKTINLSYDIASEFIKDEFINVRTVSIQMNLKKYGKILATIQNNGLDCEYSLKFEKNANTAGFKTIKRKLRTPMQAVFQITKLIQDVIDKQYGEVDNKMTLYAEEMNKNYVLDGLNKSHVTSHTRATKAGKVVQVRDYENRKTKENEIGILMRKINEYSNKRDALIGNKIVNSHVYKKYKEYIKTGKYPYLRSVQEYIMENLPSLDENQKAVLYTEVAHAADKYRQEIRDNKISKLQEKGWEIFTEEAFDEALNNNYRIKIYREAEGSLGTSSNVIILKPVKSDRGKFLMKPHASKKGFYIRQFIGYDNHDINVYKYIDNKGVEINKKPNLKKSIRYIFKSFSSSMQSKYPGGKWITISDKSSPMAGRHLFIVPHSDGTATIAWAPSQSGLTHKVLQPRGAKKDEVKKEEPEKKKPELSEQERDEATSRKKEIETAQKQTKQELHGKIREKLGIQTDVSKEERANIERDTSKIADKKERNIERLKQFNKIKTERDKAIDEVITEAKEAMLGNENPDLSTEKKQLREIIKENAEEFLKYHYQIKAYQREKNAVSKILQNKVKYTGGSETIEIKPMSNDEIMDILKNEKAVEMEINDHYRLIINTRGGISQSGEEIKGQGTGSVTIAQNITKGGFEAMIGITGESSGNSIMDLDTYKTLGSSNAAMLMNYYLENSMGAEKYGQEISNLKKYIEKHGQNVARSGMTNGDKYLDRAQRIKAFGKGEGALFGDRVQANATALQYIQRAYESYGQAEGSLNQAAELLYQFENKKRNMEFSSSSWSKLNSIQDKLKLNKSDVNITMLGEGSYKMTIWPTAFEKMIKERPIVTKQQVGEMTTSDIKAGKANTADYLPEGLNAYLPPDKNGVSQKLVIAPHQQAAARLIAKEKRAYLNFEAGTGKSAAYLASIAEIREQTGKMPKTIISMPQKLMPNFKDEVEKFSEFKVRIVSESDSKKQRERIYNGDPNVITLVNKEKFNFDRDIIKNAGYDMVIIDEAHRSTQREGRHKSAMSEGVSDIASSAEYFIAGTGSPTPNDLSELYFYLKTIDPEKYGNQKAFMEKYKNLHRGAGMKDKLAEILHKEIDDRVFTVKKDLQHTFNMHTHNVQLTDAQKNAYKKEMEKYKRNRKTVREAAINRDISLNKILNETRIEDNNKFAHMGQIIDNHIKTKGQDEKVLIYAKNYNTVREIERYIENKYPGNKTVHFTGETTLDEINENKKLFKTDKNVRFAIHTVAGTEGLNLQYTGKPGEMGATTAIAMASGANSYSTIDQFFSRSNRTGVPKEMTVDGHLVLTDTPHDIRTETRLEDKKSVMSLVDNAKRNDDMGVFAKSNKIVFVI